MAQRYDPNSKDPLGLDGLSQYEQLKKMYKIAVKPETKAHLAKAIKAYEFRERLDRDLLEKEHVTVADDDLYESFLACKEPHIRFLVNCIVNEFIRIYPDDKRWNGYEIIKYVEKYLWLTAEGRICFNEERKFSLRRPIGKEMSREQVDRAEKIIEKSLPIIKEVINRNIEEDKLKVIV